MNKTIYLVRHGQSETNVSDTFAGQLNTPLSELGMKQSNCLLEFFKNVKIDEIYSSVLQRAYDTIKPVADALNIKIKTDDRIKEIYGGDKPKFALYNDQTLSDIGYMTDITITTEFDPTANKYFVFIFL